MDNEGCQSRSHCVEVELVASISPNNTFKQRYFLSVERDSVLKVMELHLVCFWTLNFEPLIFVCLLVCFLGVCWFFLT